MNKTKTPSTFRLSEKGKRLLALLAEKHGVNQTSIVEMAVREKAERDGVQLKESQDDTP